MRSSRGEWNGGSPQLCCSVARMLCETSHSSWVGACQQQQQLSACFTAAARYNIKQILNVQMLKDELEGKVHLEIKMQSVYSLLVPKFSAAVHKTFLYNRIKTLFTTFCQPRSPPQLLSVSARLEGVNSISSINLGIWGASGGLDYCTDELYRDISCFFFFFLCPHLLQLLWRAVQRSFTEKQD